MSNCNCTKKTPATGACCSACAEARQRGAMAPGTTCLPCRQPRNVHAAPLDWRAERIDRAISEAIQQGMRSRAQITLRVVQRVYPVAADRQPIDWERVQAGREGALPVLRRRVRARVGVGLAAFFDQAAAADWHSRGWK